MTTPGRTPQQPENDPGHVGTALNSSLGRRPPESASPDEPLGEQLIREAREGHAEFVAGWRTFMEELGIQAQPIGAKQLREMLLQEGITPEENEFSRGI